LALNFGLYGSNINAPILSDLGSEKSQIVNYIDESSKGLAFSNTIASTTSETEVIMRQFIIGADAAKQTGVVVVIASLKVQTLNQGGIGNFRLRVGTAGTTSDSQVGGTITLGNFEATGTADPIVGGSMVFTLTEGVDYNSSGQWYISITGVAETTASLATISVESATILGA